MEYFLVIGILISTLGISFLGIMSVSVRRDIEDALKNAFDDEEKDEIRKRVVKTFYPPRFNKD